MASVSTICLGIDPKRGQDNTYSWPSLSQNGNTDSEAIICGWVPQVKGPGVNILQEQLFIGGLNLTQMYRTFIRGVSQDDGNTISADAVLSDMAPLREERGGNGYMRAMKLSFPRINAIAKGLTVQFAMDTIDPHENVPSWSDVDTAGDSNIVGVPSGLGRHINLRIVDETDVTGEPVFDGVDLHFINLSGRPGGNE